MKNLKNIALEVIIRQTQIRLSSYAKRITYRARF